MTWLTPRAGQDTGSNFIFADIQPAGSFQKVFHTGHLLCNRTGRRFARDNADFAARAIHKRWAICCAQGQNIYVEKRGADSSGVQLNLILPESIIKQNRKPKWCTADILLPPGGARKRDTKKQIVIKLQECQQVNAQKPLTWETASSACMIKSWKWLVIWYN